METQDSQNNTPSPTAILLMGFAILLIIAGAIFLSKITNNSKSKTTDSVVDEKAISKSEEPIKKLENEQDKSLQESNAKDLEFLTKWLEEQKRGINDSNKLCAMAAAIAVTEGGPIYSLSSYEIVNEYRENPSSWPTYTVRINSSTKQGIPISKLWKIKLWRLSKEGKDASDFGSCISDISEQ